MYNEWNRRVVTFCFIIKLLQQYFVLLQVWIYTCRTVLSHICVSEGRENVSGWWISYLDTFILLKLFLTYTTHTNFKFSFRKDNWEKQMEPLRLLYNSIQFSECIFLIFMEICDVHIINICIQSLSPIKLHCLIWVKTGADEYNFSSVFLEEHDWLSVRLQTGSRPHVILTLINISLM